MASYDTIISSIQKFNIMRTLAERKYAENWIAFIATTRYDIMRWLILLAQIERDAHPRFWRSRLPSPPPPPAVRSPCWYCTPCLSLSSLKISCIKRRRRGTRIIAVPLLTSRYQVKKVELSLFLVEKSCSKCNNYVLPFRDAKKYKFSCPFHFSPFFPHSLPLYHSLFIFHRSSIRRECKTSRRTSFVLLSDILSSYSWG